MNNIEGTKVTITVNNNTDTTNVVSLGNETKITNFELDMTNNLVSLEINLDGIVNLNSGIRETNSTSIVSYNEGDLLVGNLTLDNLAKLELSFVFINAVENETSLNIIKKTETISRVFKGNNI